MEVYYITLREHDQALADLRQALLKRSGAEILWNFDEPLVLQAASLKARYPLSFADAIIVANARRHDAVLLHKDPEFDALSEVVRQERLPAKPAVR
jgi:predicted nucleic acid-binding protein